MIFLLTCTQPGQAATKKDLACPGNSKFQIPNPKSQIPNKGVSFGQILNAFGEGHTAAFLSFKKLR